MKPKSLFSLNMYTIMRQYVYHNETMAIGKFQRSRLTFNLSVTAAHIYIGVPLIYQKIVFSETTKPIELKFHIETP